MRGGNCPFKSPDIPKYPRKIPTVRRGIRQLTSVARLALNLPYVRMVGSRPLAGCWGVRGRRAAAAYLWERRDRRGAWWCVWLVGVYRKENYPVEELTFGTDVRTHQYVFLSLAFVGYESQVRNGVSTKALLMDQLQETAQLVGSTSCSRFLLMIPLKGF